MKKRKVAPKRYPKLPKISAHGRRDKGMRLELKFASMLRGTGVDPTAMRTPLSGGAGIKGDITSSLPYHFSCKNQEVLYIWKWWTELLQECPEAKTPILVFTGNRRPTMIAMEAHQFLEAIKK